MAYSERELREIEQAVQQVMRAVEKFKKEFKTEREKTFLNIGLRASHFEEAVVQGDLLRAKSHADALLKLLGSL